MTCTTDGVFFSDDSTVIGHISKKLNQPITLLKGELDQLRLATNELIVTNKDEGAINMTVTSTGIDAGVPIAYATGVGAGTGQ